jgi:hypothetical protein
MISKWSIRLGIAVFSVAIFFALIILTPWSVGICDEEVVAEANSPTEAHLARIYRRNCGATTGYLTHVNLRDRWNYFNPTWVGTIVQGQVFAIGCTSKVDLVWVDESNLNLRYESCSADDKERNPVFMKKPSVNGINILYDELPVRSNF